MSAELYLINKYKSGVYHIFDGKDTACKMYSTGGLRKTNYNKSIRKPLEGSCCKVCLDHLQKKTKAPPHAKNKPSNALFKLAGDFTKQQLIASLAGLIDQHEATTFYNITIYGGTNTKKTTNGPNNWKPKPSVTNQANKIVIDEDDTRLPWEE